tara:strand:- start:2034 stop:2276 length:243 start_codon:yes stop_codon:yes gene_type:complete
MPKLKKIKMPERWATKYRFDELVAGSTECVVVDDYSRELMQKIGSAITSYKRKKGNEIKTFTMRKIDEEGELKIGIWRVK